MMTLFLLFSIILMTCCCPVRVIEKGVQDSLHVEVKERVVYVHDTLKVEIPKEVKVVETRDTTSTLETSVAVSTAHVSRSGILRHTLENKPYLPPIKIEKPVLHRDSIIYRYKHTKEVVEVKKPLSKWVKMQIAGFWICIIIFGLWIRRRVL